MNSQVLLALPLPLNVDLLVCFCACRLSLMTANLLSCKGCAALCSAEQAGAARALRCKEASQD